jgi:hypothetical protein
MQEAKNFLQSEKEQIQRVGGFSRRRIASRQLRCYTKLAQTASCKNTPEVHRERSPEARTRHSELSQRIAALNDDVPSHSLARVGVCNVCSAYNRRNPLDVWR